MAHPPKDDNGAQPNAMGRVLDSRWMMAVSVLAVLVAIAWALLERSPVTRRATTREPAGKMATVELLGVPAGSVVLLDGKEIDNTLFGVSPNARHALEVTDDSGRSWRQVFVARGSLSLVVELRTHFVEVEVSPTDLEKKEE
jgi:hypothetical protein